MLGVVISMVVVAVPVGPVNSTSKKLWVTVERRKNRYLCPVHLPGQNLFCLGQNLICPRQNDFVQDNIFFCPRQKFCPQLKNHFCSGETHFKPWTKFLSWTKNILS